MMQQAIDRVIKKQDLTEAEMMEVMSVIMEGMATPSQIGGFLTALRMKGETVDEIIGSAKAMREKALRVDIDKNYAIDTCGTGGDMSNTFNISTASAFVAAAAGATVVKHGNRSVSSKCGSADVLDHLGAYIHLTPEKVKKCVEKLNIGFMFAPHFHQAMKYAVGPRRELGIRTIFNVLGPLTNPARVQGQVLGVYDEGLTEVMAEVLNGLGIDRAMVVHGLDGLDEITITTRTKVSELKDGEINTYYINPERLHIPLASKEKIEGGDAAENAKIILGILRGDKGAKRDMVLINGGAAIYVGKQAASLEEGIERAKEVIDTGLALEKLNQFIQLSQGMKQ
ncbi:anthranilate phosphoribosyltransferase [Anaerosolibacter sp.]|uniref:anthranilate phosphoribosyltransferase n=1 Tax=Anaerosolibacter sp. TaxID=1872527 RepID=UPI0039F0FCE3